MSSPLNNIETFEDIRLIERRQEKGEIKLEENTLGPNNPQEDPPLELHFEQNLEQPRMGEEARENALSPILTKKPSSIVVSPSTHPFELKSNILSYFPIFRG